MSIESPIYLDHSATTPVDAGVFEVMRPYFMDTFGNAASKSHDFGRTAEQAVARARNQVAALIGADAEERTGGREIVFTSGATESNNLAIKGVADAYKDKGRHIITQVTEHKAVLDTCQHLAEQGCEISWLDVDRHGRVTADQVARAMRPDTILVSIMWANNETGTLQPVRDIGRICHERGAIFHTDATQAAGKLPIDVQADGIDLLSLSAHKFYGPKGCGALYVRKRDPRVRLTAQIAGGGHERGFRSGTLNVPGIVGLGAACDVARASMPAESLRLAALRDRLQRGIQAAGGVTLNGHEVQRLPHILNLSFAGITSDGLGDTLDGIAVSGGSACNSASIEASYVLRAMGVAGELARTSLRFSLGRSNTETQIDVVVERVTAALHRLRETISV